MERSGQSSLPEGPATPRGLGPRQFGTLSALAWWCLSCQTWQHTLVKKGSGDLSTYTQVYIYIYIHMYKYTHTYIYIHILHVHTQKCICMIMHAYKSNLFKHLGRPAHTMKIQFAQSKYIIQIIIIVKPAFQCPALMI